MKIYFVDAGGVFCHVRVYESTGGFVIYDNKIFKNSAGHGLYAGFEGQCIKRQTIDYRFQ
jgi:hypothetical protein